MVYHDVFYTFALLEPQDVNISLTMEDGVIPSLTLTETCENAASEVLCLQGTSPRHLFQPLDSGTYFVRIGGAYQANFDLSIQFLGGS